MIVLNIYFTKPLYAESLWLTEVFISVKEILQMYIVIANVQIQLEVGKVDVSIPVSFYFLAFQHSIANHIRWKCKISLI